MTDFNLTGRSIGPYQIGAELGRGGMAVVYRARQTDLNRDVALKILPPALTIDKGYVARFYQEARSAAALEHPHIVPIYNVGEADGLHFIAMKFIQGRTLKEVVQQRGALSLDETITIIDQVAEALDYAHSHAVIHRDIKPSNIMLDQRGWVYLTDFGLARGGGTGGLTVTGTVMGTPEYMSPEQAQGLATIGSPTDMYALGVVIYELLTGNMPFQADTPMAALAARLLHPPTPPSRYRGDLPLAVEDVLMRALARRPEARYATARELIQALRQAQQQVTRPMPGQPAYQHPQSPPAGLPAYSQPQSPASGLPAYQQPQGSGANVPTFTAPQSPPAGLPAYQQPPSPAGGLPAYQPPPGSGANIPTFTAPQSPAAGLPAYQPPAGSTPAYVRAQQGPTTPLPRSATAPVGQAPTAKRGPNSVVLLGALGLILLIGIIGGVSLLLSGNNTAGVEQELLTRADAAFAINGGMDQAIELYQQVLEADADNVTALNRLAMIYNLRDRSSEAEEMARAAIAANPQSAEAHAWLANALSGQQLFSEAMEMADRAIELDASLSLGYAARASVLSSQAQQNSDLDQIEDAISDAEEALRLSSAESNLHQALAHNARGYVYWVEYIVRDDDGAIDRGVREFNQAIGLAGQIAQLHSNLGYFYEQQDKPELARQLFNDALDVDAGYGHAHSGLGWNAYYAEDYELALDQFERALELNDRDSDAYVGKAYTYSALEQPEAAIATLEDGIEIEPRNPWLPTELGWTYRNWAFDAESNSDQERERYAQAEASFRAALELNEEYVNALTGLGWVLQDQGTVYDNDDKLYEALEVLNQSIAINDTQAGAYNALGWSNFELENYLDAELYFRGAIDRLDDYANAYYGLGRALEEQDRIDEAIEAYAAGADAGSTAAQTALDRLR